MSIKVENVSYSYDNNKTFAIKDISTFIDNNEFVAIIGHTGSGKSTFIQTLNALSIPSIGKITVDEFVIENKIKISNIKNLRKKVGIVFQFPEYQLFQDKVEKDILFGPKNFGMKDVNKDLAIKALKLVGLPESFLDKSPFELSGGEKRRVAIAGILAFDPDVLILDEPTAGLDPISATNMLDLFKSLHNAGKTIILVTHQMEYVLNYATRVIVFKNGNIISDSTPSDLYNKENIEQFGINVPDITYFINKMALKYPDIKNQKIDNIDKFVTYYKDVIL